VSALSNALLTVEVGSEERWEQLLLTHRDGREIAVIERNEVVDGSLAEEEIDEFIEEVDSLLPTRAAQWVAAYLRQVKTVYAFQVLSGVDEGEGWSELGALKSCLWSKLGGILQADGEGFSNEAGYHVVWQFSETVSGPWWMGILGEDGRWIHFQMELGNLAQRGQFLRGELPLGVTLA
jgi:hypothetical protein